MGEHQSDNASLAYRELECRMGDEEAIVEKCLYNLVRQVDLQSPSSIPLDRCVTIPKRIDPLNFTVHGQVWRWSHLKKQIYDIVGFLQFERSCFSAFCQLEICLNPAHYTRRDRRCRLSITPQTVWAKVLCYKKHIRLGETYLCTAPCTQIGCIYLEGPEHQFHNLEESLSDMSRESMETNTIRQQMAEGIALHYVYGHVVLELLADFEIYVHSKYYNEVNMYPKKTVCKLSPYRCRIMRLMGDDAFHSLLREHVHRGPEAVFEFSKFCTIYINFIQPWNSVHELFESDLWIEVKLHRHLQWVSKTLQEMRAPYQLNV